VALGDRFGQRPAAWPKMIATVVAVGFLYSLLNDYGVIRWLSNGAFGDPARDRPGLEALLVPDDQSETAEDPETAGEPETPAEAWLRLHRLARAAPAPLPFSGHGAGEDPGPVA